MSVKALLLGFLTRAYAVLVRAYPEAFLRANHADLTDTFRARCALYLDEGRYLALASWVASALLDVLWSGSFGRVIGLVRNAHFALRLIARQPALSTVLILTLAVGTGATTALFALVDAALLRPLPYPGADRLVSVHHDDAERGPWPFAVAYLSDLRGRITTVERLAGFSPSWELTLTGLGEPRRVTGAYVTDGLFELFGVVPTQGRGFAPDEQVSGGPRAVIVSRPFWNRHFGEGAPLGGQSLQLEGEPYPIVGVVEAFPLPITSSLVSSGGEQAELWLPFSSNPLAEVRAVPIMNVVGRLAGGTTLAQAVAEVGAVGRALEVDNPGDAQAAVTAVPLADFVTRAGRGAVLTLFGAAVFLLLIACSNVATLLLSRAGARAHELAVRRSLGAERGQLIAQLLTESLLIAVLGCGSGLLLASWLIAIVPGAALPNLPPSAELRIDFRLAAFAALLSVATAAAFGLAPALQASARAAGTELRSGSRATGGGHRFRSALVTTQVALSFTLLVGAGLLGRSLLNLVRVDPGFQAEGLLRLDVPMDAVRYPSPDSRRLFLGEVLSALRALPGVSGVAAVNRLPLGGGNVLVGVEVEGSPAPEGGAPLVDRRVATPGYFALMGTRIVQGREFSAEDVSDSSTPSAVVNEAFMRRFWPGGSALEQRARLLLRSGPGPWLTVVGVVADVHHHGLDRPAEPEIYVPYAQAAVEAMIVLLRGDGDLASLTSAARESVWRIDDQIPLDGTGPVSELVRGSVRGHRTRALVLNAFAWVALGLAALGIYGVISSSVAQRTPEIGVRLALGARRADVLGRFVREGLAFSVMGVALGLAGTWLLRRVLSGFLFAVEPSDPATLVGVCSLLLLVAAAVSYLPARRAAGVDPVRVMRGD